MAVETPFRRKNAAMALFDPARATDSSAVLSEVVLRAILSDTSADAVSVALINHWSGNFRCDEYRWVFAGPVRQC